MTAPTKAKPRAISQFAVFDKVGFRPHPGQVPILSSHKRNSVVSAGRRFGKSEMGGHRLTPRAYRAYFMQNALAETNKRHEYWIVGPEYSDSEKEFRVIYNDLSRLKMPFDKPGTYNNPHDGDMHISLWDGRFQIHAKSAKYPATLVGEGLSGVLMVEAAKLKESVWIKYIRPTLADYHGDAMFSSTPEGRNWFYRLWQKGQDPNEHEWASWRCPAWMNPFVYPGGERDSEILSLRRDLSSASFNQEIAADFSEFVGRVMKDFDEEVHVRDLEYNPHWLTVAAVDYGFTNPFVWLLIQVGPWGEVHVLDELYERGATIPELAKMIQARGLAPASLKKFYPDPAEPGDTRQLSQILRVPAGTGTGGELKNRLEWIWRGLKRVPEHLPDDHPEKQPKLLINRRCENTIREFNTYRYPKTAEEAKDKGNIPEMPMKKDDHTPEALGRFYVGHFGQGAHLRARVSEATIVG